MLKPSSSQAIPPKIAKQAVEWLVELQSAPSADLEKQCREWRNSNPLHELAWQRIESVNGELKKVIPKVAHATFNQQNNSQRRLVLKSIGVFVVGGGVVWGARDTSFVGAYTADHKTGIGEHKTIALEDGTKIIMNTDTALDIKFSLESRLVKVIKGEVLIITGHQQPNPPPFVVETSLGSVTPIGTRFLIKTETEGVRIAVFEGAVRAIPGDRNYSSSTLGANEQTLLSQLGVGKISSIDENIAAWTSGVIVAKGMRLDDFIAELSRYRVGTIKCAPSIGHLRVSGTYPTSDTEHALAALQSILPVKVSYFTRYWVQLNPVDE